MLVKAKCLAQAWGPMAGTKQCAMYYPGRGPLDEGLYEIESGTALDTLTTPTGDWIFQYPGHEGKDPELPARLARARQKYEEKLAGIVDLKAIESPRTEEPPAIRKGMSEAHKKKMAEGRARRAQKKADERLQETAAA